MFQLSHIEMLFVITMKNCMHKMKMLPFDNFHVKSTLLILSSFNSDYFR